MATQRSSKPTSIIVAVALVLVGLLVGGVAVIARCITKLPEWWASDPLQVVGGAGATLFVVGTVMCMWLKESKSD